MLCFKFWCINLKQRKILLCVSFFVNKLKFLFSFVQHSIRMVGLSVSPVTIEMIELEMVHFVGCNFDFGLDFDCLLNMIVVDTELEWDSRLVLGWDSLK